LWQEHSEKAFEILSEAEESSVTCLNEAGLTRSKASLEFLDFKTFSN
jgi:hypothetical protein